MGRGFWQGFLSAKGTKVPQQRLGIRVNLAFPNYEGRPPQSLQLGLVGGVAGQVAVKLLVPIFGVSSRSTLPMSAVVAVPETTLYQYGGLVSFKHEVGGTGQLADVKAIAKP